MAALALWLRTSPHAYPQPLRWAMRASTSSHMQKMHGCDAQSAVVAARRHAYVPVGGGQIFPKQEFEMAQAARGFFRSAVDALVEARTRQANAYVRQALRGLDEQTLKSYGYSRRELEKLGR
jgi:hypothetical protein